MRVSVFRREHFNAAHRLHNPAWDQETNQRIFGKCNNPHYHGHNYDLTVCVTGEVDPGTGYVIDTKVLSDLIKQHVTDPFDHHNLNLEVEEFQTLNPTAEHIAFVIFNRLRPHIPADKDLQITLYETERNFVKYPSH